MFPLRQILRRLWFRRSARSDSRLKHTHAKHAQFLSFLEQTGFRSHDVDRYERRLQRRQFGKVALLCAVGALVAWIAIESAEALTLF